MRVISNDLNDTLRVFKTIKVLSLDYIESLIQTIRHTFTIMHMHFHFPKI